MDFYPWCFENKEYSCYAMISFKTDIQKNEVLSLYSDSL